MWVHVHQELCNIKFTDTNRQQKIHRVKEMCSNFLTRSLDLISDKMYKTYPALAPYYGAVIIQDGVIGRWLRILSLLNFWRIANEKGSEINTHAARNRYSFSGFNITSCN